jgi:small-conductance mechanosensitive channel
MFAADAATGDWVNAGVAVGVAVLAVWVLRRFVFTPRSRKLTEAVLRGELTPTTDTRLRLLERALYALILTAGIAIALSSFDGVRVIGRTLLTSGAIAAAILGFAARQTLANVVAGLMIAVTQPLRLGDHLAFEDHSGVVEDVSLSYTTLCTGNGTRVLIPNEKLASGVLRNDSLVELHVRPEVALWLPPQADADAAMAAVHDATGADVSVAEVTPDGVRLAVTGEAVHPAARGGREVELRAAGLKRLRAEGLLPTA